MKSIEALENWYNTESPRTKAYEYELHYRLIKKDLEVLEILKKLPFEIYLNGGGDDWSWYIDFEQSFIINEEKAKKLKEWLENDKRKDEIKTI